MTKLSKNIAQRSHAVRLIANSNTLAATSPTTTIKPKFMTFVVIAGLAIRL